MGLEGGKLQETNTSTPAIEVTPLPERWTARYPGFSLTSVYARILESKGVTSGVTKPFHD